MTEVCMLTRWHFTADTIKQIRVPHPNYPGYRQLEYKDKINSTMDNFELVMDFGNNIQVFVYDDSYRLLFHEFVALYHQSSSQLIRILCDLHPERLRPEQLLFMDMFCDGDFEEVNVPNGTVKLNSIVSVAFLSEEVSNSTISLTPCVDLPDFFYSVSLTNLLRGSKTSRVIEKMEAGCNLADQEIKELAERVSKILSDYYSRRVPFKAEIEMFLRHLFVGLPQKSAASISAKIVPLLINLCSNRFSIRRGRFTRLINHQVRLMNQPINDGPRIVFRIIDCDGTSDRVVSFHRPLHYNLFRCLTVVCTEMASSFEASDIHRLGIYDNHQMIDQLPDAQIQPQQNEFFVQFKHPLIRCVVYDENYHVMVSTFFPFTDPSVEELLFLVQLKSEGKLDFGEMVRMDAVKDNDSVEVLGRNELPKGFDYIFIQMKSKSQNKRDSQASSRKGDRIEEEEKRRKFIKNFWNDRVVISTVADPYMHKEKAITEIITKPEPATKPKGWKNVSSDKKSAMVNADPENNITVFCISHDLILLEKCFFPEAKRVQELKRELCSKSGCPESKVIEVRLAEEQNTKVNLSLVSDDTLVGVGEVVVMQVYVGDSQFIAHSDDLLHELPPHLKNSKFREVLGSRITETDSEEIIKALERGQSLDKKMKTQMVKTIVTEISNIVFGRRPRTKEYELLLAAIAREYPKFDKQQLFEYEGAGWGHPFLHTGNSNFQSRQKSYCRIVQLLMNTKKAVTTPNVRRSRVYTPRKRKPQPEPDMASFCFYEAAQALLNIVDRVVQDEENALPADSLPQKKAGKESLGSQGTSKELYKFNYSNPSLR
ncbi:unnamed protein product [Bursaphelenchus xylophilus]|uniref:(pine wood nematode) hypothetical protein n=1 Tax=Bursaphelenchus xylophilus TaxID=6326 RepID=A0A1I7SW48_BURXY|nr:unnamed protein product [Bursaphelenchus xylophilus]CAG9098809.1 unnamed protein product [Bursaphelenchus xylophilus]